MGRVWAAPVGQCRIWQRDASKWSKAELVEQLKHCDFDAQQLLENWADDTSESKQEFRATLRGLAFHRAAWSPAVTDLYTNGRIHAPPFIAAASQSENGTMVDELGRRLIEREPIYGRPINRPWRTVQRQLYRYAYS